MTLEEMLLRMQEILQILEQKKKPLSESIELLKEADDLRKKIIKSLTEMENEITTLSKSDEERIEEN